VLNPYAADAPPISEEMNMAWKKPRVTEICLALEINGYVSAKP